MDTEGNSIVTTISDTTKVGPEASASGSTSTGGLGVLGGDKDNADTPTKFTFSARTCLELLPLLSEAQIDHEFNYLLTLDPSAKTCRQRYPKSEVKSDILHKKLTRELCCEIDKIVRNYDSLILNFSYAVDTAQKHVAELQSSVRADSDDVSPLDSPPVPDSAPDRGNLDKPVSVLDGISFSNITIDNILDTVTFTETFSGKREVVYYGSQSQKYTYNKIEHTPIDYPDSPIFDNIFKQIHDIDPTFTKDNYSCLVTHYKDGDCFINSHSDDEEAIHPDSTIYTVSLGAKRTLQLTNIIGPLQGHTVDLKHGEVLAMSKQSQFTWRHGIDREPHITEPRVSLTFRHIGQHQPTPKPVILPIAEPQRPDINTQQRVLLLTDSIMSTTPTHVFDAIPEHTCIKKQNFRLSEVFGFEPEFKYTKTVIFSCGINDLSRHGLSANSLADLVCQRLAKCCRDNSTTNFVFNSILLSRQYPWLNREIDQFNHYMYELACDIPNLFYFDSHNLLRLSNIQKRVWLSSGNGIHITLDAKKLVARELVNAAGALSGARAPRFCSSRWLRGVPPRRVRR